MYRSIANFGIWCTSPPSSTSTTIHRTPSISTKASNLSAPKIRITGSIPDFIENMIRERISTHGVIREMEPASEIPALNLPPEEICVFHPEAAKRWLDAQRKWDIKYAKQKRRVQLLRRRQYDEARQQGLLGGDLDEEIPPPSALAGSPRIQMAMAEAQAERKKNKNHVGWMWGVMGAKDDQVKEVSIKDVVESSDHDTPMT